MKERSKVKEVVPDFESSRKRSGISKVVEGDLLVSVKATDTNDESRR